MADTFGVMADTAVGVGIEHTVGHYQYPTKWIPITSESLQLSEESVEGREFTGKPDVTYVKPGNESIEGTIELDAKHDCIPWLMYAMRGTVNTVTNADSGWNSLAANHYVHYLTASSKAVPTDYNTLSLTIRRAGVIFAYLGCKIDSFSFTVNDGLLSMSCDVKGLLEVDRTDTFSPTYSVVPPFGAGEYGIYIPSNKKNLGTDSFDLQVDDGGEVLFRLRDDRRSPTINKWGERSVTSSNDLDFINKDEYKKYRAVSTNTVRYYCEYANDDDKFLNIFLANAYLNDYSVDSSGSQGDLVRASASYMGYAPQSQILVPGSKNTTRRTSQIYDIEVGTSERVIHGNDASDNKPGDPILGSNKIVQIDPPASPANTPTGYVVRVRPVGSSVFDWKVREFNLAGMTLTSGDYFTPALDGNPKTGSTVRDSGKIALDSGVNYECQVAASYGNADGPVVYIGPWSNTDETVVS